MELTSNSDFKIDLLETGTRYEHYQELKELFALGVELLKGLHPGHITEGDKIKRVKLENAVEMIESRLDILSCRVGKASDLRRQVNLAESEGSRKLPAHVEETPNDARAEDPSNTDGQDSSLPTSED